MWWFWLTIIFTIKAIHCSVFKMSKKLWKMSFISSKSGVFVFTVLSDHQPKTTNMFIYHRKWQEILTFEKLKSWNVFAWQKLEVIKRVPKQLPVKGWKDTIWLYLCPPENTLRWVVPVCGCRWCFACFKKNKNEINCKKRRNSNNCCSKMIILANRDDHKRWKC